jgi:peptidyl-prolyl cis-trans isomerase SurA
VYFKHLIRLLAGVLIIGSSYAEDFVDGIVAIVGDEIILYSELMQTTQGFAIQMGLNAQQQPEKLEALKKEVLQNLISERVLLAKAEEDTITVDDQQVDTELENKIQEFILQLGSREKVEAQFGMSIQKIKRDYREEIRKQLIVQKVRMEKLQNMSISRREIEDFFLTKQDSLPARKPMVHLRHILLTVKAGEDTRQSAFKKILEVQKRLLAGENFEDLAKRYSEDPGTAEQGGDLGFVERGMLYKEFEEVAFQLENGEISDIVETPVGFHIIQMVEKRGDRIHVRHILVRLQTSAEDEQQIIEKLKNIRQQAITGQDFAELAKTYSEDETTKDEGGDLGWLPIEMLQIEQFKNLAYTLNEGEISEPFKTPFGYHLVKLEEKKPARKLNLTDDYEDIKNIALNMKQQKVLTEWVEELKKSMYIEIKQDLL